ncbi:hypothetical protein KSP39_PZI008937 [Platanthera zijinensis]|uniref:Uncharacterized protein n=1 Tax=Platanthera zijinensis TaxID=2320716 RepID=A0AAP0BKT7_9ASPA
MLDGCMLVDGGGCAQVATLAGCALAARSSPDLDLFSVAVVAVVGRLTTMKVRSCANLVRLFYDAVKFILLLRIFVVRILLHCGADPGSGGGVVQEMHFIVQCAKSDGCECISACTKMRAHISVHSHPLNRTAIKCTLVPLISRTAPPRTRLIPPPRTEPQARIISYRHLGTIPIRPVNHAPLLSLALASAVGDFSRLPSSPLSLSHAIDGDFLSRLRAPATARLISERRVRGRAGSCFRFCAHIVSAVRVFYRQRISFFVALLVVLNTQYSYVFVASVVRFDAGATCLDAGAARNDPSGASGARHRMPGTVTHGRRGGIPCRALYIEMGWNFSALWLRWGPAVYNPYSTRVGPTTARSSEVKVNKSRRESRSAPQAAEDSSEYDELPRPTRQVETKARYSSVPCEIPRKSPDRQGGGLSKTPPLFGFPYK